MIPAARSLGSGRRSRAFAAAVVLLLLGGIAGLPQSARAVDAGTVTVRLHSCPAGFDGINATLSQLALSCTLPIGGVDFTVQYGSVAPTHQTDVDGSWQFTNVASGPVTVTEFKPDPSFLIRASCSQFDVSTGVNNYQEAPVGQGSATWNLQAGQAIDCDWYNFPVASPTPAPTAATVMVRLHDCPNGFDAAGASLNDLAANCHGTPSGVTFTLAASNGPPRGGQTDGTGFITWQGIPPGSIAIAEVPPSNRDVFRVFCNQRTDTGGELGFSELPVASAGISDTIQSGYNEYDCDWFNAATPKTVTVTVIPLPPTPTPAPAPTDTPAPTNTPVQVITNNPTATAIAAKLTIETFTCAAGYDVFANNADPATDCTTATVTISFTLSSSGNPVTRKTGSTGKVSFTKLQAGAYQLVETMPAGVSAAFIGGCASTARDLSSYPFTPFASIGASGKLGVSLQAGETLDCRWYDVPDQHAAAAAVTITVRKCPGQSAVQSQCAAAGNGIQFTLTPAGAGKALTLTTDGRGIAKGDVPAGTYQLAELGKNWCLADSSAFDQNANLVVGADPVDVAIYNCGA